MVRVEIFSFGDLHTEWWFEVISSLDVVDIADSSRSHPDFSEVDRPNSSVCIFTLIL